MAAARGEPPPPANVPSLLVTTDVVMGLTGSLVAPCLLRGRRGRTFTPQGSTLCHGAHCGRSAACLRDTSDSMLGLGVVTGQGGRVRCGDKWALDLSCLRPQGLRGVLIPPGGSTPSPSVIQERRPAGASRPPAVSRRGGREKGTRELRTGVPRVCAGWLLFAVGVGVTERHGLGGLRVHSSMHLGPVCLVPPAPQGLPPLPCLPSLVVRTAESIF